jgi:hypothetical protein
MSLVQKRKKPAKKPLEAVKIWGAYAAYREVSSVFG